MPTSIVRLVFRWLMATSVWPVVLVWTAGQAAVVERLYEAEVQVEERSREALQAGFQEALREVLVRVTGRRAVAGDPDVAEMIEQADRLVQGWGYIEDDNLRVEFDRAALERALTAYGQPVWGRERPLTLFWLAVDNGLGDRFLLGVTDEGDAKSRDLLLGVAEERGIPIVFPLLDAEDLQTMSFSDLWGGFDQTILTASERYGADAVLVGRARRLTNSAYRVRWSLYYGDAVQHWEGGLQDGIETAADAYARDFATAGVQISREIFVSVAGIELLNDYARVLTYLENLTLVKTVAVDRVNRDTVVYRVLALADEERLNRAIGLGGPLEPDFGGLAPLDPPTLVSGLSYRLRQ